MQVLLVCGAGNDDDLPQHVICSCRCSLGLSLKESLDTRCNILCTTPCYMMPQVIISHGMSQVHNM